MYYNDKRDFCKRLPSFLSYTVKQYYTSVFSSFFSEDGLLIKNTREMSNTKEE